MWNNPKIYLPADNKIIVIVTPNKTLIFGYCKEESFYDTEGNSIDCFRWIDSPILEKWQPESNLNKAIIVLTELKARNPLRNDKDAYLYRLIAWGLGKIGDRPSPEDFGLLSLDSE